MVSNGSKMFQLYLCRVERKLVHVNAKCLHGINIVVELPPIFDRIRWLLFSVERLDEMRSRRSLEFTNKLGKNNNIKAEEPEMRSSHCLHVGNQTRISL